MKKTMKKILATTLAGMFALTAAVALKTPVTANAEETEAVAHLNINKSDWSEFERTDTDVTITGDGQYTVSSTLAEATDLGQFNAIEVADGEAIMGGACVLTVDSIKINGADVTLQGESYTCSSDGKGVDTRVNLYNEYNDPNTDENDFGYVDCRSVDGDVESKTARLVTSDDLTGVTSIEVTFTVTNFGVAAGAASGTDATGSDATATDGEDESDVDLNGTYNAYLYIQGPKYTFRDKYENESTGYGTALFNQITFQGKVSEGTAVPGTINDVEIKGNGTYTVSITGIEWPDDEFDSASKMNLIGVSTDIPMTDKITISDIILTIDGKEIDQDAAFINPDSDDPGEYLEVSIQNMWASDYPELVDIGYYTVPFSDISVTFTVSGFDYDNDAAVAADDSASSDDASTAGSSDNATTAASSSSSSDGDKSSPVVPIIIVVVVVAVVVAVVLKKKK